MQIIVNARMYRPLPLIVNMMLYICHEKNYTYIYNNMVIAWRAGLVLPRAIGLMAF